MSKKLKIFSGRSNPILASRIASFLGKDLGALSIKTFSDGELWLQFEENIRGTDVFIIQPTNSPAEMLQQECRILDMADKTGKIDQGFLFHLRSWLIYLLLPALLEL